MNCDFVIWTQPSGPLCLWQCFTTKTFQAYIWYDIVDNIFLTSQWLTVRAATWGQSWSCFKIYLCKKWLLWEFLDDAEQGSLWRQGTMLRTGLFQQRLLMQQWLGRSGLEVGLRKRSSVTAADRVCIKTSPSSDFIEPGRKNLGRLPTLKTCTKLFNGWADMEFVQNFTPPDF